MLAKTIRQLKAPIVNWLPPLFVSLSGMASIKILMASRPADGLKGALTVDPTCQREAKFVKCEFLKV